NPFVDEWNVSLPGMSGPQVADNLALSLELAAVPIHLSSKVESILPQPEGFAVSGPAFAQPLFARHVVLATGVRARGLSHQGSVSTNSDGLMSGPGAQVVAQAFRGKRVAVLGGGDNAFENALYAQERGAA